jgi:putative hydrolase of the HAD superfamily
MKIRSVWFDLGLTLVYTPVDKVYQQVLASFGIQKEHDDIKRAFYLADKTFMRDYPHVLGTDTAHFMPWFLGIVNYHLGIRLNLAEAVTAYQKSRQSLHAGWQLIPGAAELLKELKVRGIHTGLISNWDASCRSVLAENGLDALLETVVVSSETGVEKPDPQIFEAALNQSGIEPEQTLFVGDNYYDDVIGAAKCGIRCLLLAPYGNLGIEEIKYQPMLSNIGEVLNYLE